MSVSIFEYSIFKHSKYFNTQICVHQKNLCSTSNFLPRHNNFSSFLDVFHKYSIVYNIVFQSVLKGYLGVPRPFYGKGSIQVQNYFYNNADRINSDINKYLVIPLPGISYICLMTPTISENT